MQVILITHQAQIASKANIHLKIHKMEVENSVQTFVSELKESEKEKEIARMLAGEASSEAIQTAKRMLVKA